MSGKPQKDSPVQHDEVEPEPEPEVWLLVLYTGGTIGMKIEDGVYKPEPNYLVSALRAEPIFNDTSYSQKNPKPEFDRLVLPLSKEGKRIVYWVDEYDPLLDSSNMNFLDYKRMATDIKTYYGQFDAFVILHGTDTMAYTASALSFMMEHLGKPVIVTGSQIPIFEQRTDGRENFLNALIMAGLYAIPEVTIFFDNKVLRGNRSTKINASGFDAFHSPNMPPLAELEINVDVQSDLIFNQPGTNAFDVLGEMNAHVGVLRFFPGITTATVKSFLQSPMQGAVIETYGAGNGPTADTELMVVLHAATDRGVIMVNITQCRMGSVVPSYETGAGLEAVGLIAGHDMMVEAALMKLSYVLSKTSWTTAMRRQAMKTNLRGEMTIARSEKDLTLLAYPLISEMVKFMKLTSPEEVKVLREYIFPQLLLSAAREGNSNGLHKLKEAGAGFNMTDHDQRTPLHVASAEGHLDTVKYLLDNGAPVHVRDRYGRSPLDEAIQFNRHDIISELRHAGAHLRHPPAEIGEIMCKKAAHGKVADLKSWHEAGADINQGDDHDRTPLHLAVNHGNEEMVKYLLSVNAKVDQKDRFGHSAADDAENLNLPHILTHLLNK